MEVRQCRKAECMPGVQNVRQAVRLHCGGCIQRVRADGRPTIERYAAVSDLERITAAVCPIHVSVVLLSFPRVQPYAITVLLVRLTLLHLLFAFCRACLSFLFVKLLYLLFFISSFCFFFFLFFFFFFFFFF